jgi:transcriptional regulator with XRE-family HTH domain
MGLKRTDEFRQDAVRIALTSGLTRKQVADDLGVGMSTLNKWINGRHHFFELISRSIALSRICSASNFFSLPFSSSKARNRFASEGSIPPYFDSYL